MTDVDLGRHSKRDGINVSMGLEESGEEVRRKVMNHYYYLVIGGAVLITITATAQHKWWEMSQVTDASVTSTFHPFTRVSKRFFHYPTVHCCSCGTSW